MLMIKEAKVNLKLSKLV